MIEQYGGTVETCGVLHSHVIPCDVAHPTRKSDEYDGHSNACACAWCRSERATYRYVSEWHAPTTTNPAPAQPGQTKEQRP